MTRRSIAVDGRIAPELSVDRRRAFVPRAEPNDSEFHDLSFTLSGAWDPQPIADAVMRAWAERTSRLGRRCR